MSSFSAAASLGPIVLSQSGQDSVYLQLKKTFLDFYTTEQKEAKRCAALRSLSADCPRIKASEARMTGFQTTPAKQQVGQSGWGTGMTPSTRSHSPSDDDNYNCQHEACDTDGYSFSMMGMQQLAPVSQTWDVSKVADIPSFVPPPMVFMQPWQASQMDESQAAPKPAAAKKNVQKKDLSKFSGDMNPSDITTVMVRGIPCSFSQGRVLQLLDDAGLAGKFNFFYLPCAGKSPSNLGYAFVNFVDAESASTCQAMLDGVALDPKRSVKLCSIAPADIQGLENLRKHFRRTAISRSTRGPMFLKVEAM